MNKYGVRIYPLDDKVILVKQTVRKEGSPTYVVDTTSGGQHREAHIKIDDDQEIAEAVRAALRGRLKLVSRIHKESIGGNIMACKCPVCGKPTAHVGTLFSHLINIRDSRHETWLFSYCRKKGVNLGGLLADRVKEKEGATKPLTDLLKNDFCADD